MQLIPVSILTDFIGSGKTAWLNHILPRPAGQRIAVIETTGLADPAIGGLQQWAITKQSIAIDAKG